LGFVVTAGVSLRRPASKRLKAKDKSGKVESCTSAEAIYEFAGFSSLFANFFSQATAVQRAVF
jgi:hypothetical protein